jgi:ABC-type molybdate transport system substrate-binding protein
MHRLIPFLVGLALFVAGNAAAAARLTVFAAASLADAMKAIDQAWTSSPDRTDVRYSPALASRRNR